MVWSRIRGRGARGRCRPRVESLEAKELLAGSLLSNAPALAGSTTSGVTVPSGATDFDQIVGASATRAAYGVDGTGQSVAVIDTGVDYNNEALGSGFGPGHKVVAGYDFADGTADPIAVNQHGTAVAGLIAGDDPGDPGIAPGADIVALRVFDSSGNSSFTDVAAALQWVVTNHAEYNITVVNMSISDGNNDTANWYATDGGVGQQITGLIGQLDAMNIPVVVAAGNSFSGQQGMGFPAIVPDTISVTSADASGNLASNAQRLGQAIGGASATDIAAPGVDDYAPDGDGAAFGEVTGTSFAAPIVSGSVVLLQQIYEQRFGTLPSVDQLDSWIQQGSDPIEDPTTGITIGELDLTKAAALIPPAPSAAPTSPPPAPAPPSPPPPPPPPTVSTEVYLNGQDLGSVATSQADAGWAAFLSTFPGGVASVQTWTSSGSAASTALPGTTIASVQEWTTSPTPTTTGTAQAAGTPAPAAQVRTAGAIQSTPATVSIPRAASATASAAHPALHAAAARHAMVRAWDSSFARYHRAR